MVSAYNHPAGEAKAGARSERADQASRWDRLAGGRYSSRPIAQGKPAAPLCSGDILRMVSAAHQPAKPKRAPSRKQGEAVLVNGTRRLVVR